MEQKKDSKKKYNFLELKGRNLHRERVQQSPSVYPAKKEKYEQAINYSELYMYSFSL